MCLNNFLKNRFLKLKLKSNYKISIQVSKLRIETKFVETVTLNNW